MWTYDVQMFNVEEGNSFHFLEVCPTMHEVSRCCAVHVQTLQLTLCVRTPYTGIVSVILISSTYVHQ